MQQRPQFPGKGPAGQQGPKKGPKFSLSWVYAVIAIALMFLWFKGGEPTEGIARNISYSEFKQYVSKGYAEKVVAYDNNKVELTIIPDSVEHLFGEAMAKEGKPVTLHLEVGSLETLDRFLDEQHKEGTFTGKLDYKKTDNTLSNIFWNIFPFILLIGIWMFIMRRMGGGGGAGAAQTAGHGDINNGIIGLQQLVPHGQQVGGGGLGRRDICALSLKLEEGLVG